MENENIMKRSIGSHIRKRKADVYTDEEDENEEEDKAHEDNE